ncbi:hypothetical protein BDR26DRAFT_990681 [Obelidium mucronatum]|nr:hypothetical protein BDR26DRAFT_990681 [Obelidium mucronatum]
MATVNSLVNYDDDILDGRSPDTNVNQRKSYSYLKYEQFHLGGPLKLSFNTGGRCDDRTGSLWPSKPKVVLDRSYTGPSTANENQALLDECTDLKFQIMTLESSKFMDRGIIEHKTQELVMAIQVKEAVQEQAIKDRDTSKKSKDFVGISKTSKRCSPLRSGIKTVDNLQEELRRCYQQMDSLQKELDTTYKPVVAEAVEEKDFQYWRQKHFFRAKRRADDAGSVQNTIANFLEVKCDSLTVEKAYQAGAAAIGAQLGLTQDYANKRKATFDAKEIRRENKRKQQQRDERLSRFADNLASYYQKLPNNSRSTAYLSLSSPCQPKYIKKAILLKLNENLNKRYSYTPTNFTKALNMVLAAHIGRDEGSSDLTRSLLRSLTMQTATLKDIQSSLGSQTSTQLGFTTAGNVNPVETVHNLIELAVTKYGTERRAHQDLADAKSDLRAKVLTLENATEWRIDVERVYSEHKTFFNNNLDSFVKSFVCALAFTDSGNVHLFKLTIKDDPTWSNFETAWKALIETPTAVAAKARSLYNFKFESGDAIVESTRLKTLNSTLGTKKSNNDALKRAFASGLAEYDKFYWGKITKPFRVHHLNKLVSLEDPDVTLEDVANFLYEKGMSGDSFHRSGGASSPVDRGLDQVAQLLSKRDQKINDKFNDVSEQVKSLLSVVTPLVMQQKRVERETRDVSRERDRRPGTEAVKAPYRPQKETMLSFLDTETPLNDWNETAEAALEIFNMSRDEKDRFKSKFRPQSVLCSLCKRPGHMHADCPDVKEFLEYKRLKDSTSAGGNGI